MDNNFNDRALIGIYFASFSLTIAAASGGGSNDPAKPGDLERSTGTIWVFIA